MGDGNMNKKSTAPAQGGEKVARHQYHNIASQKRRALDVLANGSRTREELDAAVGASNSPDVVFRLRGDGWVISCERVSHVNRDGRVGWHGVYSLAPADRQRLRRMRQGVGS